MEALVGWWGSYHQKVPTAYARHDKGEAWIGSSSLERAKGTIGHSRN